MRRPSSGYYDRTDNYQNSQNDYRGNGYDNRDPMYFNSIRGGSSTGGSSAGGGVGGVGVGVGAGAGVGGGVGGGGSGYDAGAYDGTLM